LTLDSIRLFSSMPRSNEETPPWRVLLVEDHAVLAEVTAEFLSAEGLDVHIAPSGRDALALAATLLPHLVLCDLNLPDMTGLDVARELRVHPSTARSSIVILTAMDGGQLTHHELQRFCVDAFIAKPITIDAIRRLVQELGQ
jgi:CheY-like chemotaxis protein